MTAVSVLIRTIGRQAALKDAMDSLARQTCKDFEVVVVEDGPATLGTFLAFYSSPRTFENVHRLTIRYEALGVNKGRSIAGNRALALAQGECCLFLDEDDMLYPEHLRLLLDAVCAGNRKIAYSWSEERQVERAGDGGITRTGRFKRYRYERYSLLHLIAGNFVPINAVLFARPVFEQAGGFDEDIDSLEDWLLWLRFAAIEPEWVCVPKVTAIYHVPFNTRSRRRNFHAQHAKIKERMAGIRLNCSMEKLHFDLKRNFFVAIASRKLYYYLRSFIRWP